MAVLLAAGGDVNKGNEVRPMDGGVDFCVYSCKRVCWMDFVC